MYLHNEELTYTGEELRPHFLLSRFGLKGSTLAAFVGPCHVKTEHLVDWEDRLAEDRIEAAQMVHFLGEFFGITLREGVYLQRLFIAQLAESLREYQVIRSGNDLWIGKRKLSVSIVTASPVSVLLHVGVNVDPSGAPVPAVGLAELKVDPKTWASQRLDAFLKEREGVEWACAKVRPVM